ncbi:MULTISPECIES: COP23 domain-containing protein [Nostoc]|uniref:Uncharacterized protein n=1 Tax=Nostoc paludosum FACHB-159 TaxID=2692908 RepID=A0ABR8KH47_9NOSO|nr:MULTISPECIES: COP23 domain-containing protein [Nostoc]MBD2680931.1 hypothetical protein [Nostoc sp. FACHB-857]MBD2737407.1 hypothetical protein [Nostoc paludosum FACHB-159]
MKTGKLLSIILFCLAFAITQTLGITPTFSQANSPDRVSFFCQDTFDRASNTNLPTTLAWVLEKRGHTSIILWKSEYFPGWNPRQRCEIVSPKFQSFYNQGSLKYLTNGKVKGYPVICAVANEGEKCGKENQLFQLKDERSSELVIYRLINILEGGGGTEALYQNSGKQMYVPLDEFLRKAPTLEQEKRI